MNVKELVQQDIQTIADSIQKEATAFEGQRFLLSGGAGFLGSYFVATLLHLNKTRFKKPATITILDNYITGSKKNVVVDLDNDPEAVQWVKFIEHDVRKPLPENLEADYVIHAAGLASPFYYRKFPIETIEVAVTGTKNFLEFAKNKKVKSVLYFSSSEIYGDPHPNYIPTPETYWGNVSATGPRACYDESKRLGETLCATYNQLYQVPVKVVRPFNVYGPGMKTNDYRVIPTFMVKAIRGENMPVHDKGNQTRTFCYITDAMQGFFKVLASDKNGEAFNIGKDKEEVNMMVLADTLRKVVGGQANFQLVNYPESYPAGEPQRRCPDLTKAHAELNYNPTVDLKTGLTRTLVWYKEIVKNEGLLA